MHLLHIGFFHKYWCHKTGCYCFIVHTGLQWTFTFNFTLPKNDQKTFFDNLMRWEREWAILGRYQFGNFTLQSNITVREREVTMVCEMRPCGKLIQKCIIWWNIFISFKKVQTICWVKKVHFYLSYEHTLWFSLVNLDSLPL